MKKLERIVDTDKYDYTSKYWLTKCLWDMGYEWDIINGYMGGNSVDKKMSYERALALT